MSSNVTLLTVFEENYKLLFRVVYSITHDINDTLDILQETFLRAFIHYNPRMSSSETLKWLITISKNTAKTYVKQNKSFEPLENHISEVGTSNISFIDIFIYDFKKHCIIPNNLCDYLLENIMDNVSLLEISHKTGISYERLRYWKKKLVKKLYLWIKEE